MLERDRQLAQFRFERGQESMLSRALTMRGWAVPSQSPPIRSSSINFSPGRSPISSIAISPSGLSSSATIRPESSIISRARSMIRTGSPMSSNRTSPSPGQRAGLDDQLRGFGNGHEITGRFAVRDRHRTAGGDLLAEARNDRAARAEHVAEADTAIARLLLRCGASLDDQLADALGRPHHIRRPNRLVGAHENELANAATFARQSRRERAQHIIANARDRIALHHWHMLVRGRMEHRIDGMTPEHALALTFVGYVHEFGRNFNREILAPNDFPKLDIDEIERVLGVLGKDDEARPLANDLPARVRSRSIRLRPSRALGSQ